MKEKLKKYDKAVLGVIIGTLLPILGFLIAYPVLTRGENIPFEQFVRHAQSGPYSQNIMIFSMLPNMFLFYFTNFRWNLIGFTKGLVAVTILLGLMLVIINII